MWLQSVLKSLLDIGCGKGHVAAEEPFSQVNGIHLLHLLDKLSHGSEWFLEYLVLPWKIKRCFKEAKVLAWLLEAF